MLPGIAAREPYEFDPVEDYVSPLDPGGQAYPPADPMIHEVEAHTIQLDEGAVVTGGVRTFQHPEVLLAMHPRLWPFWARWSAGVARELPREAYKRMSHVEVRGWQIMSSARARADRRELDALSAANQRKGAGDGDG